MWSANLSWAQEEDTPNYVGGEGSFVNYFYKYVVAEQKSIEGLCDTSLGMVEFQLNNEGKVILVHVPNNFPAEVISLVEKTIKTTLWNQNESKERTIFLPLYISVESGCKQDDIRRGFGTEKDFRMMLSKGQQESGTRKGYILQPISFVIPYGQDHNSIRN